MPLKVKPHNAKKAETLDEAAMKCAHPVTEPKWDGWRMIVVIDADGTPTVWSRTGKPYHAQTPEPIMQELRQFPSNTILDGEMVDSTHNKNCVAVTNVFGKSKAKALPSESDKIQYVIFDCLEIGGIDVRAASLKARREAVAAHLEPIGAERIAITPQAPAEPEYVSVMLEQGFEGVMVKDLSAPYAEGKRGWGMFKMKSTVEIDVVVTDIIMDGKGQHEGKAGRFVVAQWGIEQAEWRLIERARVNPYDDAMRNAMTADPESFVGRVCTIKHYGRLRDGLRHPTFVRWREDKPAKECEFDNG